MHRRSERFNVCPTRYSLLEGFIPTIFHNLKNQKKQPTPQQLTDSQTKP